MLGLPKTMEFNKRIQKQKFYDNLDVSPALKKVFVNQVKTIYWRNKIATTTVNLAPGTDVTESEVFEIKLDSQTLNEEELPVKLEGLDIDTVYENFVRQIAGDKLQAKIRKEKQLNRQMLMNGELKRLKKRIGIYVQEK